MRAYKGSLVTFYCTEYKKTYCLDFPSSPVVKTPCFQYGGGGARFKSLAGELRSRMLHGMAKKKKKRHTGEFPWASLISVSLKSICCLSFLYFVKYLCSSNKIHLLQKASLSCFSYSQWAPAWSRKLQLCYVHCHLNRGRALSSGVWWLKNRSWWQEDGVSRPC